MRCAMSEPTGIMLSVIPTATAFTSAATILYASWYPPEANDPKIRRGARGETRTPMASRPPDRKVAPATHGTSAAASSRAILCRSVLPGVAPS